MTIHTTIRPAAALCVAALLLSACGSSDSKGDSTGGDSPANRPGFSQADVQKVRDCLVAAGIDVPDDLPTDLPSDMPTDQPSDLPTDGAAGRAAELLSDPSAQGALQACGIELPTNLPSPSGG